MSAGDTLQGERVDSVERVWDGEPGAYYPMIDGDGQLVGLWMKLPTGSLARLPNKGHGTGGPEWDIRIEDDGTVTVSPSIEQHPISGASSTPYWHGYLERGVWREA